MSPSWLMCRILARSSLENTGNGRTTCRQDAGCGSRRFASGPIVPDSEVTSSSRIASSGGVVTLGDNWAKKTQRSSGVLLGVADGGWGAIRPDRARRAEWGGGGGVE